MRLIQPEALIKSIFMVIGAVVIALWISNVRSEIVIHVSPEAEHRAVIADISNITEMDYALDQAISLLQSTALRNSDGSPKDRITIQLAAGLYPLKETIKLDASASGTAEFPVLIQGPKGGTAIISGGKIVDNFSPVIDPTILARLKQLARIRVLQTNLPLQGITDFGVQVRHGFGSDAGHPTALQLIYRNQTMPLARWPNQGFAIIDETPEGKDGLTFSVKGSNSANWGAEPELLVTGYWFYDWADTTVRVGVESGQKEIFRIQNGKLPYGLKTGQRIFFQNLLSELDQPGEWYLDQSTGIIYFWPPEQLAEGDVEASVLEKLLIVSNVSYLSFSNLVFQSARGDAITIEGANHVAIMNTVIRNIGNRAAVIGGNVSGISDSRIEDIGEGGVVLQGGDRQTLTPGNLYADRNVINRVAGVSRTYQSAILMAGVGNRAEQNTISDSPHTAIFFAGNDHLISKNDIFNVCQETGDAGVIYTGRDWTARGTVISKNHLYDIPHNISWGKVKGVYLDDQASGITVRENQFDNLYEAVFIGGGRDNLIESNIFRSGVVSIHLDARGENCQKYMVVDEQGSFRTRLESVPYKQTRYKTRYPNLPNILEDDLGMPKYNLVRKNKVIGGAELDIYKEAAAGIAIEGTNRLKNNLNDQIGN